jgi:hypothetical protein
VSDTRVLALLLLRCLQSDKTPLRADMVTIKCQEHLESAFETSLRSGARFLRILVEPLPMPTGACTFPERSR